MRLAEEKPDFFAALERGEYKTVRAAAIAAGLVKSPNAALPRLKYFWSKAAKKDRQMFLKWMDSEAMPITTECSRCGTKLEASEQHSGKSFPCPKCKSPVIVPMVASVMRQIFDDDDDLDLPTPPIQRPKPPTVTSDELPNFCSLINFGIVLMFFGILGGVGFAFFGFSLLGKNQQLGVATIVIGGTAIAQSMVALGVLYGVIWITERLILISKQIGQAR